MKVTFRAGYPCARGETILVVGSSSALGKWDPQSALVLQQVDEEYSEGTVENDESCEMYYKYLIADSVKPGCVKWEHGENRTVDVQAEDEDVVMDDKPFELGFGEWMEAEVYIPDEAIRESKAVPEETDGAAKNGAETETEMNGEETGTNGAETECNDGEQKEIDEIKAMKPMKPFWKFWQSDEDFAAEVESEMLAKKSERQMLAEKLTERMGPNGVHVQ